MSWSPLAVVRRLFGGKSPTPQAPSKGPSSEEMWLDELVGLQDAGRSIVAAHHGLGEQGGPVGNTGGGTTDSPGEQEIDPVAAVDLSLAKSVANLIYTGSGAYWELLGQQEVLPRAEHAWPDLTPEERSELILERAKFVEQLLRANQERLEEIAMKTLDQ